MKKFFLLAAAGVAMAATAAEATPYMIGANVNGISWQNGDESCWFTALGNGVYEWKGEVLGNNFKINDGTWDNAPIEGYADLVWNIGSNGETLSLDEAYYPAFDSGSGNILFADCDEITEPVVVLNLPDQTITVSGKIAEVEYTWHICGVGGNWANDETDVMTKQEDGQWVKTNVEFTIPEGAEMGEFKIAADGYAKEYGSELSDAEPIVISAENLSATLFTPANGVNYTIEGIYDVYFNEADAALVLTAPGAGVAELAEDEVAEYYTLDGVKVENPVNGVYVKVIGKKAVKELVK